MNCPKKLPANRVVTDQLDDTCYHSLPAESTDLTDPDLCKLQTEFICDDVPRLSHSTLQNVMRCYKLAYYAHVEGWRVREHMKSNPLKLGTLWDAVQDKHYGADVDIKAIREQIQLDEFNLARIRALNRAYIDLGLAAHLDKNCLVQEKKLVTLEEPGFKPLEISMVYDRLYENYFVDSKLTSNQRYYNNRWDIQSQMGTYFLTDESLEYCIIEIVQYPDRKPYKESKSRPDGEALAEFEERFYLTIMGAPGKVFIGLNRDRTAFGLKFFRGDFDLGAIKLRYFHYHERFRQNIQRTSSIDNWHDINDQACFMYGSDCDFLPACKTGGMSQQRFEKRTK
jgi:hypothetical protein